VKTVRCRAGRGLGKLAAGSQQADDGQRLLEFVVGDAEAFGAALVLGQQRVVPDVLQHAEDLGPGAVARRRWFDGDGLGCG
jgi:hypothetical protein